MYTTPTDTVMSRSLSYIMDTEYQLRNISIYPPDKKSKTMRTSIRLTKYQWAALEDIYKRENISRTELFTYISQAIEWKVCIENRSNRHKKKASLSNAVRTFILLYYQNLAQSGIEH